MYYSDDPARDFDRYDTEMAMREAKLPKCEKCEKPINADIYFDVNGDILCENCMHDIYSRSTEDYIRDNY